ncbi:MAG: 6-bladed beta-propeller [Gemmatimonadota bacterium]
MPIRRKPCSTAICGVVVLVVGCGVNVGSDRDDGTVPPLVAEETLRIGSVDDPETALTSIRALEIASDGRIVTMHSRDRQIRVHAADGTPLVTFGGRGDGPGEFQTTTSMSIENDELRVWDSRNSRITRFDLDGTVLEVQTVRKQASDHPFLRTPHPQWALSDGSVIGEYGLSQMNPGWEKITETPIVRFGLDGEVLDTVAIHSFIGWSLILDLSEMTTAPIPFAYNPLFRVSPARMEAVMVDRVVDAADPGITVTKLSVDGDTLWRRGYGYDPVAIDPAYVDSFVVGLTEQLVSIGFATARRAEAAIRETMVIPDHAPAVDRVLIGHDGSTWLALADRDPETTRWLVLDPNGDVHGRVTLPHDFRPLWAMVDVVWGMDRDELDIPYIVRFDVRAASRADSP